MAYLHLFFPLGLSLRVQRGSEGVDKVSAAKVGRALITFR